MTIVKTFETQQPRRFPRKYIILTSFCLVALVLVEIWASNTAIAYGEKYEKLSSLEKNLKMQNQILENDIATSSSLKMIATKSAQLGFSNHQSIQYIR